MKIRPVGVALFHADVRTERREEANSCFAILRMRLKTTRNGNSIVGYCDHTKGWTSVVRVAVGARNPSLLNPLKTKLICFI
jgi:hypothetical protein